MSSMQGFRNSFDITLGVQIPLRDGVSLSATVYKKRERNASAPCIVILTPYTADTYHDRASFLASRGLYVLVVDARGRGNSGGIFRPMIQEANDGYDVVEWVAGQEFCNGKVAMCGGSYNGYAQWATAKERPPHLITIVPTVALYAGLDFPKRNNIFYSFAIQWLAHTSGRVSQGKLFSDTEYWLTQFRRWHESGRPFCELDEMLSVRSCWFQEWLDHPMQDDYWDAYSPSAEQYSKIEIPVLTITGIYDDDQPGALQYFKEHSRHASDKARNKHYLVIGPWTHSNVWGDKQGSGKIRVGEESLLNVPQLHVDWYRWTMQDGTKPSFLKKRVAYYVMVADYWKYADSLEDITCSELELFLDSTEGSNGPYSSGSLGLNIPTGKPDSYTYDPVASDLPEIEAQTKARVGDLTDQSIICALGTRLLIYHTEPFAEDLEIGGFFSLSVWISIDCPDTDLYASIYEISADGGSIRLSTDAMRARYRFGLRECVLVESTVPQLYEFSRFTFVSRVIKKGSRLRLVVAPVGYLVDAPFAEKNYNSGGLVAREGSERGQPVTVSIFHDQSRLSKLRVPISETGVDTAGRSIFDSHTGF